MALHDDDGTSFASGASGAVPGSGASGPSLGSRRRGQKAPAGGRFDGEPVRIETP